MEGNALLDEIDRLVRRQVGRVKSYLMGLVVMMVPTITMNFHFKLVQILIYLIKYVSDYMKSEMIRKSQVFVL